MRYLYGVFEHVDRLMSYEQVIVAGWQAAAAPYKNRAIVVCSGKGQDPTLVKPAIRACRSEGTERAHFTLFPHRG